ncbi:MAG: two-component sensor histidine kinase [Hoeflea sp.]|uniref:sensor histidine kinase n=1 Tax=Hoeflea sp. TaxID=1940281 RepID=UPI000C0D61F5|nr:HAMP domain-containing sensor histidine kinase [Hoeflea sp.]PHR25387.1 MAG: two-component sensor histidine kinase [Hoeflea sp.]
MQVLVLIAFTAIAAVPIYRLLSEELRYETDIIDDIANAIVIGESGNWQLVMGDDLATVATDYPDFWFHAYDSFGQSVQFGELPDRLLTMMGALKSVRSANVSGLGPNEDMVAILRRRDGVRGPIWIAAGNGPEIGIISAFGNPIFIGLLLLLSVISFLIIPRIVRRDLRGIDQVARNADMIDFERRGIRLSMAMVPDELHPLVRAVNAALQRLDDGIERRHRFIASAAHELRTPIAILQTRLELMDDVKHRSRLMFDVTRLANLANQLLDLERLEAEVPQFQRVNLVELAKDVAADMAPIVLAAGDTFTFDAETASVPVLCDPPSLSRALMNLIQNAVHHGGASSTISVTVGADATFRVADTGQGIPEAYREVIFEPFGRVAPLDHGAGLGLALVRNIVARHNGRVTVGEASGGGALFEISLPRLAD